MDPECRAISKLILPAIRASVAEAMNREFNYKQNEIAGALGVVQVSVSKYLNRKYSAKIGKVREYIDQRGLNKEIVKGIRDGVRPEELSREVDRLCASLIGEIQGLV